MILDSTQAHPLISPMAQSTPVQFEVPEIHCDGCVRAITRAVQKLDPAASVSADLATKRVVIGGTHEAHDYAAAIEAAGYTLQAAG
jgi:copper chaperone CopZ